MLIGKTPSETVRPSSSTQSDERRTWQSGRKYSTQLRKFMA
jgi:hypothetical protein